MRNKIFGEIEVTDEEHAKSVIDSKSYLTTISRLPAPHIYMILKSVAMYSVASILRAEGKDLNKYTNDVLFVSAIDFVKAVMVKETERHLELTNDEAM
jgi:hypothetical protein